MIPKSEPDSDHEDPAVEYGLAHYCVTCSEDCVTAHDYELHVTTFSHIKRETQRANETSMESDVDAVSNPEKAGQSSDDADSPQIAKESALPGYLSCEICDVDFNTEIMKKFHMFSAEHITRLNSTSTPILAGLGNVYSLAMRRPTDSPAIDSPDAGIPNLNSPSHSQQPQSICIAISPSSQLQPASCPSPNQPLVGEQPAVTVNSATGDFDHLFFYCDACSQDCVDRHKYILHLSSFRHM
jgi:hypothetical protein